MPRIGLEPTHLAAPEPKSGVSTNFTTWAQTVIPKNIYLKAFAQAISRSRQETKKVLYYPVYETSFI